MAGTCAIVVMIGGVAEWKCSRLESGSTVRCPGFESLSRRRSRWARVSLAVVFDGGHVARVLVMFDDDARGERRAALVDAALARMRLANEVPYLVTVDDVLGFLEASARPVPVGRVMLNPAMVGGVGDVCECFVNGEHCVRFRAAMVRR